MGYWSLVFLLIAIVAATLGFSGLAGDAAWIAHTIFVAFLTLFLAAWAIGARRLSAASKRAP